MHEIAREAGYTAPSLYTYFRSKQEIFDGLVALFTQEMLDIFEAPVPRGLTFAQRLELLLGRQLELCDQRHDMYRIFFQLHRGGEVSAGSKRNRYEPATRGFELYSRRLADWMREAAEPGEIKGHEPEDAAYALVGIVNAYFFRWLVGVPGKRLAEDTQRIVDLFLHGVRGRGAQP